MPPIPVHIEDPIAPAKASGITPQTQQQPPTTTAAVPANTTPISPTSQRYTPAAPAQAAVPAPTGSVVRSIPAPTRTTQQPQENGPPPPQPGAVPLARSAANATGIPPPPTNSIPVTAPPVQAQWPSPQQNYAPSHSTDTSTPQHRGPTTINLGPVTTSPGGYQQNVYAQDLSSTQRASLDQQERREQQDSGLLGNLSSPQANETVENMFNTVKAWSNTAGKKLGEAHNEAWKWIDGKK